jgi:Flp pilus assembly protein TadG
VLRRGGGERGAVAVEAAFMSIVLVTLFIGVVETAYLIRDSLSVSAAARAGARMGSSDPRGASFAQSAASQVANAVDGLDPARVQKLWVYRANTATGLPASGSLASCTAGCVTFVWNAALGSFVASTTNWAGADQNACAGDPGRNALGVHLEYRHASLTGTLFEGRMVSESTVMLLEPIASGLQCRP